MMRTIFMLPLGGMLFVSTPVSAGPGEALECITSKVITREDGDRLTQIENTCQYTVKVFWCLNGGSKQEHLCGQGGKFFKWSTSLAPGQIQSNSINLPTDTPIQMQACWGRLGKGNEDGSVTCPPPPVEDVRTQGEIDCDGKMSTFVVYTPRPGIFRFEGSDGGRYTFNTRKDGKEQNLDMEKVRQRVCSDEGSGLGSVEKLIIEAQEKLRKAAETHSEEAFEACKERYGEVKCEPYRSKGYGSTQG